MDQMRAKGFKKENQTDICTEKCAMMHRFLCNLIRGVKLKIKKCRTILSKNKKADGRFYDHPLYKRRLNY
jgi:hypothetical protein